MARIRSIKHDFFLDSKIAKKQPLVRLFFIGLWCLADKEGRLEEDPDRLKLQVLPYDKISVENCLAALHPDFIIRYQLGHKRYIQIKNFVKHQHPHPNETSFNIPSHLSTEAVELHCKPCNSTATQVGVVVSNGNGNGNGNGCDEAPASRDRAPKVFVKPTAEDVTTYAKSLGYTLNGRAFISKYESIGWVVGKNRTPMKDWRAVVRTWKENDDSSGQPIKIKSDEDRTNERLKSGHCVRCGFFKISPDDTGILRCDSCNQAQPPKVAMKSP